VTAALFLVDALPAGGSLRLGGAEGHHAATVARVRVGERLLVGDGRGALADAEVTAVGRGEVTLALAARRVVPAPDPRLVVAQGIPKGDRGELAVQAMTEVGVDAVVPWAAARCVVQWRGERGDRSLQRWRASAREAAKQARRAWLPEVAEAAGLTALTARVGSAAAGGGAVAGGSAAASGGAAFVLHEAATARLATAPLPASGEILLVVGPEGGIADAELDALTAAGAAPVRLGDTVLRTSTAGVAALSVLATRLGRW
jgi:16S rRNA (uracil1498-N3)-methyltransferase